MYASALAILALTANQLTRLLVRLRLGLVAVLLDLVPKGIKSCGRPLTQRRIGVSLGDLLCNARAVSSRHSKASIAAHHELLASFEVADVYSLTVSVTSASRMTRSAFRRGGLNGDGGLHEAAFEMVSAMPPVVEVFEADAIMSNGGRGSLLEGKVWVIGKGRRDGGAFL